MSSVHYPIGFPKEAGDVWQTYKLRDAALIADPNNLQSGSISADGDFDEVTITNSGTIRIKASEMLAFVFPLRDATGALSTGRDLAQTMEAVVEIVNALPDGMCVSTVFYDGAGAGPSATDHGGGIRIQAVGAGLMTHDRVHSVGAGWLDGSESTPGFATVRFGHATQEPGSTITQGEGRGWVTDALGDLVDGALDGVNNGNTVAQDTLAICLGWFDAVANPDSVVSIRGHSFLKTRIVRGSQ